jgi:hypothetical protein
MWAETQLEAEPGLASQFCLPHSRVAQPRPSGPFGLPPSFTLTAGPADSALPPVRPTLAQQQLTPPTEPESSSSWTPSRSNDARKEILPFTYLQGNLRRIKTECA